MANPFPRTFNNSQQTWGNTTTGGLQPVLSYPNSLFSAPSSNPLGAPGRVINNNPEFTGQPQTATIQLAALSDDAQKLYEKGDMIFLYRPNRGVDEKCYPGFALWNMNYNLEMASIYRRDIKNRPPIHNEALTKVSHMDRLDDWPVTIEEFTTAFSFFGIFNTSLDKKNQRKRKAACVLKGAVTIPNIFAPDSDGRNIGVGDTCYLHVGMYTSAHQGRMNTKGGIEATATNGQFLQVKGMWEKHSHSVIGSSKFMHPREGDADFLADMDIDQYDLPIDVLTGLVNTRAQPQKREVPLVTKVYTQGLTYKLGRVVRTTKDPTKTDVENAIRSNPGWASLGKRATLDIELCALDVDANA